MNAVVGMIPIPSCDGWRVIVTSCGVRFDGPVLSFEDAKKLVDDVTREIKCGRDSGEEHW